MEELRLDSSIENVDRLISVLDQQLEAVDCPMKAQLQLDVAVEEIYSNISHYAYDEKMGQVYVLLDINGERATITFEDEGRPFNPLDIEAPDIEASAQSEKMGGLGIYMVRQSMDKVNYQYKDGRNCLTIIKLFSGEDM